MTSTMAFRCVQAWLLKKPAAWVEKDAPSLAAALMAQQPPCDALQHEAPPTPWCPHVPCTGIFLGPSKSGKTVLINAVQGRV